MAISDGSPEMVIHPFGLLGMSLASIGKAETCCLKEGWYFGVVVASRVFCGWLATYWFCGGHELMTGSYPRLEDESLLRTATPARRGE